MNIDCVFLFEFRRRKLANLAFAALAGVVLVVAPELPRVYADVTEKPESKAEASGPPKAKHDGTQPARAATTSARRFEGKVEDFNDGKPIAEATVTVRRLSCPRGETVKLVEETRHITDSQGKYSFTISLAHLANPDLSLEIDVDHPDYASRTVLGEIPIIRYNQDQDRFCAFEWIRLRPGKTIVGRILRPDGTPAKAVTIRTQCSTVPIQGPFPEDSLFYGGKVTTDDDGDFQASVATPGPAILYILPDDLAGELHLIPDAKRGNLGRFVLEPGISLKGRLLDEQGKPIVGYFINAERVDLEEVNLLLSGILPMPWIARSAFTEADGSFALNPLPLGRCRVIPDDRLPGHGPASSGPPAPRTRPDVFTSRTVVLEAGEAPLPLVIRPSSRIKIEGTWSGGNGKPADSVSSKVFISGSIDGGSWSNQANVGKDGNFVIDIPRGLTSVGLTPLVLEPYAIRWRISKAGPFRRDRTIALGTLDRDAKGIEIVQYDAPVVTVKAEAKDGRPLAGLRISAQYTGKDAQLAANVFFVQEKNGRFRSQWLQPDVEFNITVGANGFQPAHRTFALPAGKTEEITLVLEPNGKE